MRNITLSIDEETLEAGREYARRHHMSLNTLVRRLLEQTVRRPPGQWLAECYELMDRTQADSKGERWARKDLYRG